MTKPLSVTLLLLFSCARALALAVALGPFPRAHARYSRRPSPPLGRRAPPPDALRARFIGAPVLAEAV